MTQTETLIRCGAKLIKTCDTKAEAIGILNGMKAGTVAPHGDKWCVLT